MNVFKVVSIFIIFYNFMKFIHKYIFIKLNFIKSCIKEYILKIL